MKPLIVDTNILFSTLLGGNKLFRDIFTQKDEFDLFSCKYAIIELFKYKEKIQKYSMLSEDEILELLHYLLRKVHLYDESFISKDSIEMANRLCMDIDEKDIPFVALTIELDGMLWTGDKKLKKGLIKKGFNSFFEVQ